MHESLLVDTWPTVTYMLITLTSQIFLEKDSLIFKNVWNYKRRKCSCIGEGYEVGIAPHFEIIHRHNIFIPKTVTNDSHRCFSSMKTGNSGVQQSRNFPNRSAGENFPKLLGIQWSLCGSLAFGLIDSAGWTVSAFSRICGDTQVHADQRERGRPPSLPAPIQYSWRRDEPPLSKASGVTLNPHTSLPIFSEPKSSESGTICN